jgi:hypothetical protein
MMIDDQSGTQASMSVSCSRLVQQHWELEIERDQRMATYGDVKKMKAGIILTIIVK